MPARRTRVQPMSSVVSRISASGWAESSSVRAGDHASSSSPVSIRCNVSRTASVSRSILSCRWSSNGRLKQLASTYTSMMDTTHGTSSTTTKQARTGVERHVCCLSASPDQRLHAEVGQAPARPLPGTGDRRQQRQETTRVSPAEPIAPTNGVPARAGGRMEPPPGDTVRAPDGACIAPFEEAYATEIQKTPLATPRPPDSPSPTPAPDQRR